MSDISEITEKNNASSKRPLDRTYWEEIFGVESIPDESADIIIQALNKMIERYEVTETNKWQMVEYLCADYLSGP